MKGYKTFLGVFVALLTLYIVAEANKPKPINWAVTLSKKDKNPYGSFILFEQLKDFFPQASIQSFRLPVYNQLNNFSGANSAYLLICDELKPSSNDWEETKKYVAKGNYVFASATKLSKLLLDSLGFRTKTTFTIINKDSSVINFTNPALQKEKGYFFGRQTVDQYFSKVDTASTLILGTNNKDQANFIKIPVGRGAFFIHANPLCFSNYFMLFGDNNTYTAKALSYLPKTIKKLYWDEYYKAGPEGPQTPLRFFLSNEFLLWALRLSIIGLILYVLFQMKRRQRIIPVIAPLKNSTLDFVETVSRVYYNQKDNSSIADKKIAFFLDFVRQHFYLPTQHLDESFAELLAKKSGVERATIDRIIRLVNEVNTGYRVTDKLLLSPNQQIDNFYKQAK